MKPAALAFLLTITAHAADCQRIKAEWTHQLSANHNLPAWRQRDAAIRFAKRYDDDPEGCFRPTVRDEIAALEMKMIRLVATTGSGYVPQRLMICSAIDSKTQRCTSPDLDDTMLTREGESKVPPVPPGTPLKLVIEPHLALKLVALYTGIPGELQDGKPPAKLTKPPISGLIIGIFRSGATADEFAYRKAIWHVTESH